MTKNNQQKHRKRNSWFVVAVVAAVSTLGSSELFAHDAASLVRRANEEMREGNTEQALADYQQAVEAQPDRFEPLYNQAVAHYRMGQFAEARELLTQVLATSDRQLEAKARFNLANCDYSEAVASAEQDRQAAIERLTTAISHYRGALRADRSDTDSRANIELAKMLIDQLKEEEKQEQEQQQQEQQQQDQDQQQEQEQNQDQQKSDDQQDSSKNDQDQQNQDDSQQNKEPEDQSESNQDKSDDQQQSEESKPDEGKGDDKEEDQEQKDQGDQKDNGDEGEENDKQSGNADTQDNPENEQQQDEGSTGEQENSSEQSQPKPSEGEQEDPKQNPSNAQPGEPQGESDGQSTGGHVQQVSEAEARSMTQEEAQKMLQAVRDRDMMRRYEKLRQMQRLKVPVDRDW